MNRPTLANLYRQATRSAAGSALPDADTLLALARGERPPDAERIVAEVAESALQSDLLHFARSLEPASSALSAELAATFGQTRLPHARVQARAHTAAGRRAMLRRVGLGLAAMLVAGFAIWTQHSARDAEQLPVAAADSAAPVSDRIFAALHDERAVAQSKDVIFRAGEPRDDRIFRGAFSGG